MKYKKYLGFSSKIALIVYIIFTSYYIFNWYNLRILHNGKENQQWNKDHYYACKEYISTTDPEEKDKIISKYYYLRINDTSCIEEVKYDTPTDSTYNTYEEFFDECSLIFIFFSPLIILIPFLYLITREMKNKIIKNYCIRNSYKNYTKHIFKTAYKNIFTIPLMVILTFIISYYLSDGNMNPAADIGFNYVLPNTTFIDKPGFPIIFILILFLNAGLYINIGLIVLSKEKNFLVATLESELIIFLIWCFSIIGFGNFFKRYGINPDNFNLLSIYDWSGIDNMYIYILVNVFMFLVTLLIAIKSYKNKEKIILMCEK